MRLIFTDRRSPKRTGSIIRTTGMLLTVIVVLGFCRCTEDAPPVPNPTQIRFRTVNPAITQVYISSNNLLISNSYFSYGGTTQYYPAAGGATALSIQSERNGPKIIEKGFTFTPNSRYTLFLTGNQSHPDMLDFSDEVAAPADGQTKLRLVNVTPEKADVDWLINDKIVLSAEAFGKQEVMTIPPGTYKVSFAANAYSSSPTYMVFAANKTYLIYTSGVLTGKMPFEMRAVSADAL